MELWKIALGIVAFAFVTIIIFMWGLRKQINSQQELNNMLLSKGVSIVKKHLKKNEYITKKELMEKTRGMKARRFYSRAVATVSDPAVYCDGVLSYMVKTGQLVEEGNRYKLRK